jgi:hypothetical protein
LLIDETQRVGIRPTAAGRNTMRLGRRRTSENHQEVTMSSLDVPPNIFTSIEGEISSEQSPVGIDAKKTHIIILHKLVEIEARLMRIEARLEE